MKKLKFVAIVSTMLTLSACQIVITKNSNSVRGSGNSRTESRSVNNFQQISSNLAAKINITQGGGTFLLVVPSLAR
ncbi:MAG: hypothetical protein ACRC2R_19650 [Xenococcaceae cyanobacterium]